MRELMRQSKEIREQASKSYRAARVTMTRREVRQETAEEIREALRAIGCEVRS